MKIFIIFFNIKMFLKTCNKTRGEISVHAKRQYLIPILLGHYGGYSSRNDEMKDYRAKINELSTAILKKDKTCDDKALANLEIQKKETTTKTKVHTWLDKFSR